MATLTGRFSIVQFKTIDRWIPTQVIFSSNNLPKSWSVVSVGDVLHQVKERVKVEGKKEYKLIGVKWYGEGTFHRETVLGSEISATYLYPVIPNALIYNRLFAWKKSFAIVPPEHENHFVSSEFPQFIVDENKVLPHFLYLFFNLDATIKAVNALSIGSAAVSRNRFKEENFLKFKFPLPPLDVQKEIIASWRKAKAQAQEVQERVIGLEKHISQLVNESLGRIKNELILPKYFSLQWRNIDRWGVEISWNAKNQTSGSHYPIRSIGELCKVSSGGTPSRERPDYFNGNILWVKTTEVRNEVIFDTEEKITELGLKNSSARVYPTGSLLVAMYGQGATRGRTAKLGVDAATNQACAVLSEFSKEIEPDYLWYYLISEYDNLRLQASGNNQPNLNAAMIASYPVPVPPLKIQKEIIRRVEEGRSKIRKEQEAAAKMAEESEREVERMVLGLLKA
jgi:restriction endonuclease S subunit